MIYQHLLISGYGRHPGGNYIVTLTLINCQPSPDLNSDGCVDLKDHPAAMLMKDPHNQKLIAEYMAWEELNAAKQIDELKRWK